MMLSGHGAPCSAHLKLVCLPMPLHSLERVEILTGLLAVVVALVAAARLLKIPFPILLVLGGLALGFIPGLPALQMPPDLVLFIFLPPLIYDQAWFTSWRDFRANLRPILLLAIGLVVTTTLAIAAVAHALIPGVSWPVAFVLGAVVAPTDTVAAGAIANQLHLPRRIVTVLEGESLVNDASALVLYGLAVAAVVTGHFSLGHALLSFVRVCIGGIALGLALGWLCGQIFRSLLRLNDAAIANTAGLLAPFIAYLPAEQLGLSGVLAVVAMGLYLGRHEAGILSAEVRLQAAGFWKMLVFLLNGLLFILVGLQLKTIMARLAHHPFQDLLRDAGIICLTVIVVRIAWVFPATYLPRWLIPVLRRNDPAPGWRLPAVLAWTGIRGGISLTAALAIPLTAQGAAFPQRDLILFLTFSVILTTLVLQGLSLPPLIKVLGISDDSRTENEETRARLTVAQTAREWLEGIGEDDDSVSPDLLVSLRGHYESQIERYQARIDAADSQVGLEQSRQSSLSLKRDIIAAQRDALIHLRDQGDISDDILHRIENDLDLEEQRITP
jgi:Na+/H+ antiporter